MAGLAGLLDDQTLRFEELIGTIKMAVDAELQKAAAATELANQAIKAGELSLRQAWDRADRARGGAREPRAAHDQGNVAALCRRLKQALVIREQRWNNDLRRRRYATAGAVVLAVFLGGYALPGVVGV